MTAQRFGGGLMLRAEEMDHDSWWWAVSMDEGRGNEIRSSNYEDRECRTGAIARQRAEECARDFLNVVPRNKTKANKAVLDNRLPAPSRNDYRSYNV